MSHEPCSRSVVKACLLSPIKSAAMRRVSSADMTAMPTPCDWNQLAMNLNLGRPAGRKNQVAYFSDARNIAVSSS